ncbi:MAG TPA: glycoside hydrolase family 25 protein [Stellaceae bacterium]|jgi:lysozyme
MQSNIPFLPPVMSDVVIDLSHWQAEVDFAAVAGAGIAAVFLKATEGAGWVDPTFAARVQAADAAGLLVAAYHFLDRSDPLAQADHFLSVAGFLPVLALDLEPAAADTGATDAAAAAARRLADRRGALPVIYTNRFAVPAADPVLAQCPLWLAEYGSRPVCPPGWAQWTFWQYTSTGAVPGVAGPCDRSRFAGSAARLGCWWCGGPAPAEPASPAAIRQSARGPAPSAAASSERSFG